MEVTDLSLRSSKNGPEKEWLPKENVKIDSL